MIVYVVRPNESVYDIAQRYGMNPEAIISDNQLANPEQLVAGQTLVLLTDTIPHIVRRGESLYSIARAYGVLPAELQAANPQLTDPNRLEVGQEINVPVPSVKDGSIDVNGYAYPGIDDDVLTQTLPYLTYLSIFAYMARPNGTLSTLDDMALIQKARAANVAPMMVVTNMREGEGFSSELAHVILTDEGVQDALLNSIVQTLQAKNYFGLNLDFEYIYPEDGDNYDAFLRKTMDTLTPLGYLVTTSLAPKTSENQRGLLYEAHHYPVHGDLADLIILMTYEWGYTYGPAMAVAPVNQVRRVLNYAVRTIPSDKILMGMPNYGYDWTLPFVRGSAARTLSNTGAVDLALREGVAIRYNTLSQAPYFNYRDESGARHEVWFDDARSIQARLRLVEEYGLAGVSYWTIGRFFPQNWLILSSMYDINKVLPAPAATGANSGQDVVSQVVPMEEEDVEPVFQPVMDQDHAPDDVTSMDLEQGPSD